MFFQPTLLLSNITRQHCRKLQRGLVQLADRAKLIGSAGNGFPKYLKEPDDTFPYTLYANDYGIRKQSSAFKCAEVFKSNCRELLTKHGALLLRDFPLGEVDQLNCFLQNLDTRFEGMTYESGVAVRRNLGGWVYNASDEAKDISMETHNEMSYSPFWPSIIVFACQVPCERGSGQTTINDARKIYAHIDKDIADEFDKRRGVMYHYHYKSTDIAGGFSWKKVFASEDKAIVKQFLNERNIEHYFSDDDSLTYWVIRPATLIHHITGETVWFNQVASMHGSYLKSSYPFEFSNTPWKQLAYHTYFGDGSEIPEDYIQHIRNVSWNLAVGVQMQKNDVLILDNELTQHGRMSYDGERKLLAALIKEVERTSTNAMSQENGH